MLRQIITNEVRDALGRNPDEHEVQNFIDYINDYLIEEKRFGKINQVFLVNIESVIKEYLEDNYEQCPECGEYFEAKSDEWNTDRECCRNCHDYDDVADYKYDDMVCDQVMGY